jgi:hypothetical protein
MRNVNFSFVNILNFCLNLQIENLTNLFMTIEEAENKKRIIFMQLEIMRIYQKDMIAKFGKRGYDERLNLILDELIIVLQILRKRK